MGITITASIPGGNPREPGAIRLENGVHHIEPWSEDGDFNYKFHLLVAIDNDGSTDVSVDLEIDWKEEKYAYLRDQLYAGSGDEWTLVTGDVDGPTIRATVSAPPGQTLVSLHPAYRRAELEPFLASAVARGARRKSAGTSADSHEIEVLEFGDEGADRERLLVFTRFHPYETAGSYCAEGMVDSLLQEGPGGDGVLDRFQVTLVPMCSVDGVERGTCKRVSEGGPDVEKGLGTDDPTVIALRNTIDAVAPAGFLDIHGWMHRDVDGLSIYDRATADGFVEAFAASEIDIGPDRDWQEGDHTSTPYDPADMRYYCRKTHGSKALVLSFGWEGRSLQAMRNIGAAALKSFAASIG